MAFTGATTNGHIGIWKSNAAGMLELVALRLATPPGVPSNLKFALLNDPNINDAGQVVFEGTLSSTGVTTANDVGV